MRPLHQTALLNLLIYQFMFFKSPSINLKILQTDLHTFPLRISWENLILDQGIFSWVIILFILITFLLTVS